MEFKDIAHLYIGAKLKCTGGHFAKNANSTDKDGHLYLSPSILADCHERTFRYDDFKPIILPLSAMTKEQALSLVQMTERNIEDAYFCDQQFPHIFCRDIYDGVEIFPLTAFSPEQFTWLLKNHFDIYNLIESGQAIDATTLPVNPYKP